MYIMRLSQKFAPLAIYFLSNSQKLEFCKYYDQHNPTT